MSVDPFQAQQEDSLVHPAITVLTVLDTDTALAAGIYELKPYQQVVHFSTGGAIDNFVIKMPRVTEAAGKFYTLYMTARDTTDVTVLDNGDYGDTDLGDTLIGDLGGSSSLTFNLAADCAVLYSDGVSWWKIYTAGSV